jgi:predicted nucleic acid-binding Zn ribbon protein
VSRLPLLTPHPNAYCICGESFSQLISLADLSTSNLDCMAPTCPRCGHKLRKVHGRNGVFFGCTTYPKCNFTRS